MGDYSQQWRRLSTAEWTIQRMTTGSRIQIDEALMAAYGIEQRLCGYKVPILHPEKSPFCSYWDRLVILALIFTCIITPYEVAFVESVQLDVLFYTNRVVDLIFVCDLVLQFIIMYPLRSSKGTIWVSTPRLIAINYVKTWLFVDIISVFPFDSLGLMLESGSTDFHKLRLLKVVRGLRLLKLMRVLRASRILKRWQNSLDVSQQRLQLIKLLTILFLASHWMACAFGLCGNMGKDGEEDSWLEGENEKGFFEPFDFYIASMHWSMMSLTSIGYGDISAQTMEERGFGVALVMIMGTLWANVIGAFAAVATSLDQRRMQWNAVMDELNTVMKKWYLPQDIQVRLRQYFYARYDCGDMPQRLNVLVEQMSPMLKQTVVLAVNEQWLPKVFFLNGTSEEFQFSIASSLSSKTYFTGEVFGESWMLYILFRGIVARQGHMQIYFHGAVWGEDCILDSLTLLHDPLCIALTFGEVQYLKKALLCELASQYPEDERIIRKFAVRLAASRGIMLHACRMATADDQKDLPRLRRRHDRFFDVPGLKYIPADNRKLLSNAGSFMTSAIPRRSSSPSVKEVVLQQMSQKSLIHKPSQAQTCARSPKSPGVKRKLRPANSLSHRRLQTRKKTLCRFERSLCQMDHTLSLQGRALRELELTVQGKLLDQVSTSISRDLVAKKNRPLTNDQPMVVIQESDFSRLNGVQDMGYYLG